VFASSSDCRARSGSPAASSSRPRRHSSPPDRASR
jgi:hypothetical protein